MAESNLYLNSIVPILNENKKIGIGFVIKEDKEHSWLLTCKHVVYDGHEYKKKLSLQNGEMIIETAIVCSDGIDLALIKVKHLEHKKVYPLQEHTNDDALIISTYSNTNDKRDSLFMKIFMLKFKNILL